jgi:hypothetical protein
LRKQEEPEASTVKIGHSNLGSFYYPHPDIDLDSLFLLPPEHKVDTIRMLDLHMYSHLNPMVQSSGCRDLGVVTTSTGGGAIVVTGGGMWQRYVVHACL